MEAVATKGGNCPVQQEAGLVESQSPTKQKNGVEDQHRMKDPGGGAIGPSNPQVPEGAPATEEETMRACAGFRDRFLSLRQALGTVILGQTKLLDQVLWGLFADGHILLEGVPGLGKTLLVKTLARVVGLRWGRIQFTPDLLPQDILGGEVLFRSSDDGQGGADKKPHDEGRDTVRFRPGPIFNHLVLADEINRAGPKTQSALLEAMEERQVTLGDKTYPLEAPFWVVATNNPIELEGTFPLPEAQLDRFLMKLHVAMPRFDSLVDLLDRPGGQEIALKPIIDRAEVIGARRLARQVPVCRKVREAVAGLLLASHPDAPWSGENGGKGTRLRPPRSVTQFVKLGISPRGGQSLIAVARVRALMSGRFHVNLSDVAAVAYPALRHRLMLNFAGQAEGIDPDALIADLLQSQEIG